ncbi:hypothetical protein OS493_006819 [Desmophyllum pertusum]|uniref:Uncharacterized protein n=1 Tax=Desmophyllum pertusum TaxID=174260 RepID=A0A9X0D4Q1_9CNID|nr:hypothetical protein OS493_006819 [Desmophyllum pertusum]
MNSFLNLSDKGYFSFQAIYGAGGPGTTPNKQKIAAYEKLALGDNEFLKTSQLFRVKVSKNGVEYADYLPVKLAFDSVKKNIHLKPAHKWIAWKNVTLTNTIRRQTRPAPKVKSVLAAIQYAHCGN